MTCSAPASAPSRPSARTRCLAGAFILTLAPISLYADSQVPLCPGASATVTIHDYDGPILFEFCVEPGGINYTHARLRVAGSVSPHADGIFRSGFDPVKAP